MSETLPHNISLDNVISLPELSPPMQEEPVKESIIETNNPETNSPERNRIEADSVIERNDKRPDERPDKKLDDKLNTISDRQRTMPQEQNPELLHWRANVLLDEMMLGAIDIAAGDSEPARVLSSAQPLLSRKETRPDDSSHNIPSRPGQSSNHAPPRHTQSTLYSTGRSAGRGNPDGEQGGNGRNGNPEYAVTGDVAGGFDEPPMHSPKFSPAFTDDMSPHNGARANQPPTQPLPSNPNINEQPRVSHGTEQWLFAAEQRYQQIAAREQSSRRTAPAHEYDGWSMASGDGSASPYEQTYSSNPVPDYPTDGAGTQSFAQKTGVATASTNGVNREPRLNSKQGTGSRSRKSLRSNLLPRMNSQDSQSIQQEINLLQSGIESTLPSGHETRIRAQHLLQKAHTILQEDSTRSAEVDYYLQQVRTIVQRGQESAHWSNLYHSRLRLYLYGWLSLSLIVILSRYAYAGPLGNWLAWITASTVDGLLVYNLLTIAVAFFFGAFGGGVGALLNMVQHARVSSGFFDRKYGLRGLILPLIGACSGLILCVLFGLIYALLRIDPTLSVWFGLLPALIALALGASQEYFYGVRT